MQTEHETPAHLGPLGDEAIDRLRRIETRLVDFQRWMNYSPKRTESGPQTTCTAFNGQLICSGPEVTMGDIARVANRAHMNGEVKVFIGSNYWGVINV